MAAFYIDENVTLALDGSLRDHGHAVATTFEERRSGSTDPHQVLYAAERGWTLITHNRRDYRLLREAWHLWAHAWHVSHPHAGILVLEQVQGQPVSDMAELIHQLSVDPRRLARQRSPRLAANDWLESISQLKSRL